jgi:hypothetical protein
MEKYGEIAGKLNESRRDNQTLVKTVEALQATIIDERSHHAAQWLNSSDAVFKHHNKMLEMLETYAKNPKAWDAGDGENRDFRHLRHIVEEISKRAAQSALDGKEAMVRPGTVGGAQCR